MKRLVTVTLLAFLAINCSTGHGNYSNYSKSSTMTHSAGTQAQLDQGNQRINAFKQELLQQGFREVSVSSFDSRERSILEGEHGRLRDLRVTLQTNTRLEEEKPELAGGIEASIKDEQAEKEFEELYKKVVFVVTGHPY